MRYNIWNLIYQKDETIFIEISGNVETGKVGVFTVLELLEKNLGSKSQSRAKVIERIPYGDMRI